MKRSLLTAALFAGGMLAFPFYPTGAQAAVTSLDVTSATLSKSTGALAVNGTIVCTEGHVYLLLVGIFQVQGGHSGASSGQRIKICSGGVDQWELPQTPFFGSFKNGNAQVVPQAADLFDGDYAIRVLHQPITPVD